MKIGDRVKIIDNGRIFTTYPDMANKMNLKRYEHGHSVRGIQGKDGIIIGIGKHDRNTYDYPIIGVKLSDKDIIIGEPGLELMDITPDNLFEM